MTCRIVPLQARLGTGRPRNLPGDMRMRMQNLSLVNVSSDDVLDLIEEEGEGRREPTVRVPF